MNSKIFKTVSALGKAKFARTIVASAVLAFLLVIATTTSCKKDIPLEPEQAGPVTDVNPAGSITFRDGSNPTVVNGILTFPTYNDAKDYAKSLESKEQDQAQINAAYTQLGIDTSGETIPNLTDHPVCLVAEQTLGYTSARKIEENTINSLLDQGDDNVFSIVHDPYWKTLLNSDNAIRMGNRIYKYYENGGIAIVLNNDLALFDEIKQKVFDELEGAFNLVITDDSQEGWSAFFTLDADGKVVSEKPMLQLRFATDLDANGNKSVRNISLVEPVTANGSVTFQWKYANGSTFTGRNPNKTFSANESLVLTVGNGTVTTDVTEATVLACSVESFTITSLGSNSRQFSLPDYNPTTSEYNIGWEFSDGQTGAGGTVTKSFAPGSYTATCKAFRKTNGTLACQFTKNFVVNCGSEKTATGTITNSNWGGSGKNIKIDATIWVKNNEVGCKSRHFAKKLGVWLPLNLVYNSQGACVDIDGSYRHGNQCVTKNVTQEKCLQSGQSNGSITLTVSDPGANFSAPGLLSSGHRLRFTPGTWFGFGYGGPGRLVLN